MRKHVKGVGGLFCLLALALVLRVVMMVLAGVNAPLVGDELAYQQLAQNVAAGRGFFQTNNPFFPNQRLEAWQAPLYPLSLAALYFVFGANVVIAKLYGILLGVATVYVTCDLARRVFVDPRAAWWSAFSVAIYPGLMTNAHLLLSETLFTFLLVLAFDLVIAGTETPRGKWRLFAAAGAVWGLATLTRGLTLYFVAPLAVWLVIVFARGGRGQPQGRPQRHGQPQGLPLRRAVVAIVFFSAALCAVIAPWTWRNYRVFDQFVLLETKGGVNLWLGNSPYTPRDFIRNVWKVGVREPMLAALPSDEFARDRAGYALARDFILRQPLTFLARMPVKFADFWGLERNLVDSAEATRAGRSGGWNTPAKIAADLISAAVYVLLVLAALGGLVFAPDDRWKLLLGGFGAYFVAVHLVVFGDGRFHFPLVPFLALYAGWFIVNGARVRWRGARGLVALALALLFAAVWAHEGGAALAALRGTL